VIAATRQAGSRPFPSQPVHTVNAAMPFDHLVVVMLENHSLDNLLGAMPVTHPDVDGLTFDGAGEATNSNPNGGGEVTSFPVGDTSQAKNVTQSWDATHQQINNGQMNGFVSSEKGAIEAMGYYTPEVLPFAYALASTFTLANRWFSSVPGPTYPNRRFLLAGTAYGGTVTDLSALLDSAPPNGTIFDVMSDNDVNWCDYFSDVPATFVIPSIVEKHFDHHAPISKFFDDCRQGTLPAVSFVDPPVGVLSSLGSALESLPVIAPLLSQLGVTFGEPAATEEDPQSMYYGEKWAHGVVSAVLQSPVWPRTLLIYTYDEHGGYYDHVPPPPAIPPDEIPPTLPAGHPPGAYDMYGPRVPAIVVSPYSKPGGVTNALHDHTSVLATIEAKWNLPALTDRDANAAHVMDFLDASAASLLHPPAIPGPSDTGPTGPSGQAN
jgi:phospholipase C